MQEVEKRKWRNRLDRIYPLKLAERLEQDGLSVCVGADQDEVEAVSGREQSLHHGRGRWVELVESVRVDARRGARLAAHPDRLEAGRQHQFGGHRGSDHSNLHVLLGHSGNVSGSLRWL